MTDWQKGSMTNTTELGDAVDAGVEVEKLEFSDCLTEPPEKVIVMQVSDGP